MRKTNRPDYAGLKSWTRNRETGTQIGIYDALEQGLDPESGKYAVVCEDHSTSVNVDTLKLAREIAPWPAENWCDVCRDSVYEGVNNA